MVDPALRVEFEAWAASDNFVLDKDSFGEYAMEGTRNAWWGWQAACVRRPDPAVVRNLVADYVADNYPQRSWLGPLVRFIAAIPVSKLPGLEALGLAFDLTRPMVDLAPPATARERWIYEQGRLAERDPRSHK